MGCSASVCGSDTKLVGVHPNSTAKPTETAIEHTTSEISRKASLRFSQGRSQRERERESIPTLMTETLPSVSEKTAQNDGNGHPNRPLSVEVAPTSPCRSASMRLSPKISPLEFDGPSLSARRQLRRGVSYGGSLGESPSRWHEQTSALSTVEMSVSPPPGSPFAESLRSPVGTSPRVPQSRQLALFQPGSPAPSSGLRSTRSMRAAVETREALSPPKAIRAGGSSHHLSGVVVGALTQSNLMAHMERTRPSGLPVLGLPLSALKVWLTMAAKYRGVRPPDEEEFYADGPFEADPEPGSQSGHDQNVESEGDSESEDQGDDEEAVSVLTGDSFDLPPGARRAHEVQAAA